MIARGMGGSAVIAASYEAKAKGVKTGMPVREAIKLCPEAIQMDSDFRETGIASQQIENILMNVCPIIEQYSIDEWFLDLSSMVGGVPKDAEAWAKEMQRRVKGEVDISVSIGIGPTKILAKMTSEYRKPAGVSMINEELTIEQFLRSRPAEAIPGIGRARSVHAQAHSWDTAWDFAQADSILVQKLFGKPGVELQQELNGERVYAIISEVAPPKSVSRTRTFRATQSKEYLWAHILHHAQYVIFKMRKHQLACRGISVWLRDRDYRHHGTTKRLPQSLHTEETILPYLRKAFDDTYDSKYMYNQAGMALWDLWPIGATQASLFEDVEQRVTDEHLQSSLDALRKRYGRDVLTRGSALPVNEHLKPGLTIPLYEAW